MNVPRNSMAGLHMNSRAAQPRTPALKWTCWKKERRRRGCCVISGSTDSLRNRAASAIDLSGREDKIHFGHFDSREKTKSGRPDCVPGNPARSYGSAGRSVCFSSSPNSKTKFSILRAFRSRGDAEALFPARWAGDRCWARLEIAPVCSIARKRLSP